MLTTRSKILCILWHVTQGFRIGQPWRSSNGWLMRMRHWAVDICTKRGKFLGRLAEYSVSMICVSRWTLFCCFGWPCCWRIALCAEYELRHFGYHRVVYCGIMVYWQLTVWYVFASVSQKLSPSTYSVCMLWLSFSLHVVKKTTVISATRSSTGVLISP